MTSNREQQMDAVVMQASGPPAEALVVRSEPVPVPGPAEVLVEVHAAAVNPFDVVIALGLLGSPLPMIPGLDFAGVVVSDGDLNGQEVWGSQAYLGWKRPGTHAQFVALPETWLSRKPERLTMTEAGAVGRPYIAAWQAVINIMELKPGETIMITGGAGLVGQAATAIARWRGAKPIVADVRKPDGVERLHRHQLERPPRGGARAHRWARCRHGARHDRWRAVRARCQEPTFRRSDDRAPSHERVEFDPSEIYDHDRHVTGLASVFIDGADGANIFDQLAPLFDRGLLTPPAIKTWPLENSARGLSDGAGRGGRNQAGAVADRRRGVGRFRAHARRSGRTTW